MSLKIEAVGKDGRQDSDKESYFDDNSDIGVDWEIKKSEEVLIVKGNETDGKEVEETSESKGSRMASVVEEQELVVINNRSAENGHSEDLELVDESINLYPHMNLSSLSLTSVSSDYLRNSLLIEAILNDEEIDDLEF